MLRPNANRGLLSMARDCPKSGYKRRKALLEELKHIERSDSIPLIEQDENS